MTNPRKLNTSVSVGGDVALARIAFDHHLDTCTACCAVLCATANGLWRRVTLAALRAHKAGEH